MCCGVMLLLLIIYIYILVYGIIMFADVCDFVTRTPFYEFWGLIQIPLTVKSIHQLVSLCLVC